MFGEASQIERVTGFAKLNVARKVKRRSQERRSKGGSLMLSSILSFSKQ